MNERAKSVVVIGGGPGGYEAALVAAATGAQVTVVEREGLGGSAVLTDVVPSKSLIQTAKFMHAFTEAGELGVETGDASPRVNLAALNRRILAMASAQAGDIETRLTSSGIRVLRGTGRLLAPGRVLAATADGEEEIEAQTVLLSVGATPRTLPTAVPDGERILTWKQLYQLEELPEHLVVVGSGVTGAEFAQAFLGLGARVTLVSSRDRVLPGEDPDAAAVIEKVFTERGMTVLGRSRAEAAERTADGVVVTLSDGRKVEGSHVLMAVGSIPNTRGIGLEEAGVELTESGHIAVDRVSRTAAPGVYAAGDCTAVFPLASVAAMQGRIAMAHALGDAVAPLNLRGVCANIFTDPEIATVGRTQSAVDQGELIARSVTLPLARNPRAKMMNLRDGFVKLFCTQGDTVAGGVIVSANASELIFPVALAVQNRLTVDQFAATFTVYPSLSGSVAEVARMLHARQS